MRKYFRLANEAESWDGLWSTTQFEEALKSAHCHFLTSVFQRYFPRQGKILEAGCGLGQYVVFYRAQGYDIEGVDSSVVAIRKIKERYPDLPVHFADIRDLPYPSGSVAVYFSGGVMEHFEEGPSLALREAYRVLQNDGYLLMTVPWINFSRQIEDLIPFRTPQDYVLVRSFSRHLPPVEGWRFYQYYFKRKEILDVLRQAGFYPVWTRGVSIVWGIKKWMNRQPESWMPESGTVTSFIRSRVNRRHQLRTLLLTEHSQNRVVDILLGLIGLLFGHMMLVVSRKCPP